MNHMEFEQFVRKEGNDILSFCKMHTMNVEMGNDLYQDTMLKMLEKRKKLDSGKNVKAYAISMAILLWKNKKKTYARRNQKVFFQSMEELEEVKGEGIEDTSVISPENSILKSEEKAQIQLLVSELPDKMRIPVLLFYSSNMKIDEIAECIGDSPNTVKTRLRKAREILKKRLEALGYDR